MDRLVMDSKLESLRRCIARVQHKCPATLAALEADIDAQDVVVLNLSRAIQLCVDMAMHCLSDAPSTTPQTMGESFTMLAQQGMIDTALCARMRSAVGFRNLAVHNYDTISWAVVFTIATAHLDDFRAFAKAMP
jgi:uncharacterized protein YutE (UPF0331/DUF86 family)